MIRINLLPGPRRKQAQPQWDVRAEALVGIGLLVITLAGCWAYSEALDSDIETYSADKQGKEKQVALLKEQVKQVQDFEQKRKLLEDKNRIIDQLEKSRSGPVRVLDYVSQSLDPLKLWLVGMSVKGNNVELNGRALTNDDVVEFVNNLRRTDYFSSIHLMESRATSEGKTGVYQFKLGLVLKG